MKNLCLTSILLLFVWNTASFANDGLTQADLNQAASQNLSSADFMLNKAYAQLMQVLDNNRKKRLKVAQRAWIKFRDTNADFISSAYENGSIRPLIHGRVLIKMTEQRTAELAYMHLMEITP